MKRASFSLVLVTALSFNPLTNTIGQDPKQLLKISVQTLTTKH